VTVRISYSLKRLQSFGPLGPYFQTSFLTISAVSLYRTFLKKSQAKLDS
jgi:hypothetical protein